MDVVDELIHSDYSRWRHPNLASSRQLVRKLGFRSAEVVEQITSVTVPVASYYDRPVLHLVR